MKKFKNLFVMFTTIFVFTLMFNTMSFALEGDYSYYGYDEPGGIYDFSLMEENAEIFEMTTGIRPFVLVTSYLGDDTTAREYAEAFYNDENNFVDIFSQANYFIIIISDEEEVMDIFVNPNATNILTDDIISDLLDTYGNNIDNTEYYDVTVFDLLTKAEETILYNQATLPLQDKSNVSTKQPAQNQNNINEKIQQNTEPINTQSDEKGGILKYFIILALIIGIAGTIITKITLSFIHKRRKSEEDFELELERLNRSSSTDTVRNIISSASTTPSYDDDSDNGDSDDDGDCDNDDSDDNDLYDNKDDTTSDISNTYDNSTTINNITKVYNTAPTRPINLGAVPPPPLEHRHVINTGFSSPRSTPKIPMSNTPQMKRPSTPPTRPNVQMRKPSTPTTRSISHSTMRKPSTPATRVNRPSAMRRPSTPPRRGR